MFTDDELTQAIRERQERYHHQAYEAGRSQATRKRARRRWLGMIARPAA
jgi:hypothetical protein